MTQTIHIPFSVTAWDQGSYTHPETGGPKLSRATVRKTYTGPLVGEGTAELLMCQADPANIAAGAGYTASELVVGALDGREGTFVLQHGGLNGTDGARSTFGHVVPGSGTGELAGLSGTVTIEVSGEGQHTLILNYDIDV